VSLKFVAAFIDRVGFSRGLGINSESNNKSQNSVPEECLGRTIRRATSFLRTRPSRPLPYCTAPRKMFSTNFGSEHFPHKVDRSWVTSPPVLGGLPIVCIAAFPFLADMVEVKTVCGSTTYWSIHFIRLNGCPRDIFPLLIIPRYRRDRQKLGRQQYEARARNDLA